MSRVLRLILGVAAASCGFLFMWLLGAAFDRMAWPVFNSWGLAHGSFLIAWPLLGWIAYRLFVFAFAALRRDQHSQ
jgi:hypothetical protein